MKNRPVLNAFGCIFAVLFSFILVIVLTGTPIVSTLTSELRPENIAELATSAIKNIDAAKLVEDTPEIKEVLDKWKVDNKVVNDILETRAADKILTDLAGEFVDSLENPSHKSKITAEYIQSIVEENIDEVMIVVKNAMKEAGRDDYDTSKLKDDILKVTAEYSKDAVDTLNSYISADDSGTKSENAEAMDSLRDAVNKINGGLLLWMAIGVILLLSGLVYLCRWHLQRGFFWLFINSAVAAVLNIVVWLGFGVVEDITLDATPSELEVVIKKILGAFEKEYLHMALALFAAGAVCFAVYMIAKKFSCSDSNDQNDAPQVEYDAPHPQS